LCVDFIPTGYASGGSSHTLVPFGLDVGDNYFEALMRAWMLTAYRGDTWKDMTRGRGDTYTDYSIDCNGESSCQWYASTPQIPDMLMCKLFLGKWLVMNCDP